jgi:hypothetical protein
LRRSKVVKKEWITLNELHSFFKLPSIITGTKGSVKFLKLLNSRIVTLVGTNGWSFTFLYLKECVRLTIRALGGQPETSWDNSIPRVKRDFSGLPTIIPLSLRLALREPAGNVNIVRVTLCVLSVFRVFKVPVKPSLESIISPFNGIARTYDYLVIRKALNKLNLKVKFSIFRGFISESAGPNSRFATWGSTLDALAFIEYPRQFLTFVRIALVTKSYWYLAVFITILLVYGPLYITLRTFGMMAPLRMGKLSTVYDQAGKARIVAITNWWIQLALKPLHDSIFNSLRKWSDIDGTFDQGAPLLRLYKDRDPRYKFSCFDLSSATDRLPITLQVDILNALGVRGDLWSELLNFQWSISGDLFKLSDKFKINQLVGIKSNILWKEAFVKYAVGQPMGAYSSWGMLAVTHHVIVQIAAIRAGFSVNTFRQYCVLGDDIVINNDKVAVHYQELMHTLGVGINPSKSIISYDVVEFAKRWLTPYGEISPLGPGNILNCSRNHGALGSLLYEAHQKGYFDTSGHVLNLLPNMPGTYSQHMALALNAMFGLTGCFHPKGQLDTKVLSWCSYGEMRDPLLIRYSFYNGLLQTLITELRDKVRTNRIMEDDFIKNISRITGVKSRALRLLELLSLPFNPGLYLYLISVVKTEAEILEETTFLFQNRQGSWDDIKMIADRSPQIVPALLNWGTLNDRSAAKDFGKFYRKLDFAIMQTHRDLNPMTGADGTNFY